MLLSGSDNMPVTSAQASDAKLGTTPKVGQPYDLFGSIANAFNTVITPLAQNAPQIVSAITQQRLAALNFQRVQQGLPPISYDQIPGSVPTVAVQGSLDSGSQRLVLMLGGLGIGAFVLMNLMKPKHRRAHA